MSAPEDPPELEGIEDFKGPWTLETTARLVQVLIRHIRVLAKEVRRLHQYGRHNRTFIVVDVVLTVVLSLVGALSVHAVQTASQASSAQLALCRSGNVARAQQVGLWDHIISVSPVPEHESAVQRQRRLKAETEFRLYIHRIFAARDCSRLGQPGGPATSGTVPRGRIR